METVTDHAPPELPSKSLVLTIAGRTFRHPSSTTIAQDAYVMKRQRAFGFSNAVKSFDGTRESVTDASEGLIFAAFESGIMFEILAGVLVEDGVAWTRDVAASNTQFFKTLTDPVDKNRVWENIAEILSVFLIGVAEWLPPSPKSSGRSGNGAAPVTDASHPFADATNTTMESGTASSASSPTTM